MIYIGPRTRVFLKELGHRLRQVREKQSCPIKFPPQQENNNNEEKAVYNHNN